VSKVGDRGMKAVRAYVAVHRAPCEPGLMRESERARARKIARARERVRGRGRGRGFGLTLRFSAARAATQIIRRWLRTKSNWAGT